MAFYFLLKWLSAWVNVTFIWFTVSIPDAPLCCPLSVKQTEERKEKRTTINDSKSWQRELSVHCFSSIFIWLRCCKKKAHFGREEPDILICFIHANTYRHTYACTCTSSIYAYRAQWSYIRTSAWCTEYSKNITTYINESVWLNHKEVTIRPSLSSQTTMWFHPNKYKLS